MISLVTSLKRWTASEIAFRKALELDPDWILAKSLVGRITRNPQEREAILKEIQLAHTGKTKLLLKHVLKIGYHNRCLAGAYAFSKGGELTRNMRQKYHGKPDKYKNYT